MREYCLWCVGGQSLEVKLCARSKCPLWLHREGHGRGSKVKPIRARCLECSWGAVEVKECLAENCTLWPFRVGKNPNKARPDLKGVMPPQLTPKRSQKSTVQMQK